MVRESGQRGPSHDRREGGEGLEGSGGDQGGEIKATRSEIKKVRVGRSCRGDHLVVRER